jgi:hypothetical protein
VVDPGAQPAVAELLADVLVDGTPVPVELQSLTID